MMNISSIAVLALIGNVSADKVQMMTIAEKLAQINDNKNSNSTVSLTSLETDVRMTTKQKAEAKALNQLAGKEPLWGPDVKYSDQLANGDLDDDKELEDEDDPNDDIVDDNGFTDQWVNQKDKRLKEWVQLQQKAD